ncbi:MAG: hypothetical protein R2851_28900 [Caldilineaceae bacterium]
MVQANLRAVQRGYESCFELSTEIIDQEINVDLHAGGADLLVLTAGLKIQD